MKLVKIYIPERYEIIQETNGETDLVNTIKSYVNAGNLNLNDSPSNTGTKSRILLSSTSEVYGDPLISPQSGAPIGKCKSM